MKILEVYGIVLLKIIKIFLIKNVLKYTNLHLKHTLYNNYFI